MNLNVTDLASRDAASIKSVAALEIEFVAGDFALGKVLVARSPVGVCAILFGSTAEEVEQDLAASFPGSRIVSNNRRLRADLTKILQFIAVPRDPLDLENPSTFSARHSSAVFGMRFARLRLENHSPTRSSPAVSAAPNRCEQLLRPAQRTQSPWQSPSSRHGQQWIDGGLSLGHRTQAGADQ